MDNSSQHSLRQTIHLSLSSPSRTAIDTSLTSHYSFVLGDLNFRTDLTLLPHDEHDDNGDDAKTKIVTQDEETHKQAVQTMVQNKDWDTLNQADELRHVLRQKACLVGYQTLPCNFPPTFKLERQVGYKYVDKRRPSYTDRVLFKSGHQLEHGVVPLIYEPIDTFATSDHKPIRAAFALDLNPPFRVRPRTVRTQSIRNLQQLSHNDEANNDSSNVPSRTFQQWLQYMLSCRCLCAARKFRIDGQRNAAAPDPNVVDLGHGQGLGLSKGDELQLFVSKINVVLSKSETTNNATAAVTSALGGVGPLSSAPPNPYLLLMTQPEEAIRQSTWKRSRRFQRFIRYLMGKPLPDKGRTRNGWPCSTTQTATYTASWMEEEIHCHVSTHTANGASIDLSGSLLFLTVMDQGATEDSILGSFAFNLATLLKQSTENKNVMFSHRNIRQSVFSSGIMMHPPPDSDPMEPRQARKGTGRMSVFSTMFGGKSGNSTRDFFATPPDQQGQPHDTSEEHYEDDPFTTVEINEPLWKGGIEVGRISCNIEAWWVDETTANAARFADTRQPDSRSGRIGGRHSDAAFRRTIVRASPR
jgi:hypothetical protein